MPLDKYRDNIKAIVTHPSITAHKATILLVTPPPIHEVHLEQRDLEKGYSGVSRHQSFTAQYAEAVREVAAECNGQNIVLVDLWNAMLEEAKRLTPGFVDDGGFLGSRQKGDSEGLRRLLVDGLHFTGQGYKVFLEAVLPFVGRDWENEPMDNPSWIFP